MSKKFCSSVLRKMEDGELKASRDVVVTDDWYPCFPDNKVHVYISACKGSGKEYMVRIGVFGADDFGIAMMYRSKYPEEIYGLYNHWKKWIFDRVPDGVDVGWFYEHGFWHD